MKILHVINSLVAAGAEKLVTTIANEQVKKDNVSIFTFYSEKDVFGSKLNPKINFMPHVGLNYFSPSKLWHLYKEIRKHDVIHVHLFPPFYIVAIISLFVPNKTYIYSEHNTDNSRRKKKYLGLEKFMYSRYKKIICVSQGVKQKLSQWIGDSQKQVVIDNAINLKQIESTNTYKRSEFNLKESQKIIVMVGRFQEQKDHKTLIKALCSLPEEFVLMLIGEGEKQLEMSKLTIELGLENRVQFLGVRTDVYNILKMCDYGVLSSHWEGFGIAALEYMACGLPALGSNVPGLGGLIDVKECLFEQGNDKQLAEKIITLQNDAILKKTIKEKQSKNMLNYDISASISKHMETYIN